MFIKVVSIIALTQFLVLGCENPKHYEVDHIEYHDTHSEFYLIDGRIFVALKKDNEPYYENIKQEIVTAKAVYFYRGEMFIENTGEEGELISKGDISLKVKQKDEN